MNRSLHSPLSRFVFACALTALLAQPAVAAAPGVADKEIVLGQSIGLSGPLGELGQDIERGSRAYFESVNAKGGIHGRRVKLLTLDDGYKAAQTVKNVEQLLGDDQVFALFNIMGTANSAAVMPLADKAGVPLFSPFTGAEVTRVPALPGVFNVRASYKDEAEKIVQHLATVGVRKVSVLVQANAFGKDGLAGVEAAMARRGARPHSVATIQTDASDTAAAVKVLQGSNPDAIVMITAGKPTFEFIKSYNSTRRGMQFYTLSVMGAQANIKALGADGVGVVVASVVPFPWSQAHPLVKEYQAAMRDIGLRDYSFVSFESYINAKVLGEAMKRAGRDLTRTRLVAAAQGMNRVSFGGFDIDFSKESRQGSRFVELTIIGPDGRFTK